MNLILVFITCNNSHHHSLGLKNKCGKTLCVIFPPVIQLAYKNGPK